MSLSAEDLRDRFNRHPAPVCKMLGQQVLDVDPAAGTVRVMFEVGPDYCNPLGVLQGGIVAAMLDAAAALAAISHAGGTIEVPTLEFKVSFLAAAYPGRFFAEGRVVRMGRRIGFLEAELRDPDGTLLARMSTTSMPVPNKSASPNDAG
jgi:uncharacterized protein (TIGR00369 family)